MTTAASANFWSHLGFVVGFALLSALGVLQLNRAEEKSELLARYLQRAKMPAVDLNAPFPERDNVESMAWRSVKVTGHYDPRHQFLLENQVVDGRAGYLVFTPLAVTPGDLWILVNRGWVPLGEDRQTVPDLGINNERVEIMGLAEPPLRPGIVLGEGEMESFAPGIWRTLVVDPGKIGDLLRREFLPYIVRLKPEGRHGLEREAYVPGIGEHRHRAYAVQWFALAGVLLFMYVRSPRKSWRGSSGG